MAWEKVELLPVSAYHARLEQAFNIAALYGGREFKFRTAKEEKEALQWEYEQMVAQGFLSPKQPDCPS